MRNIYPRATMTQGAFRRKKMSAADSSLTQGSATAMDPNNKVYRTPTSSKPNDTAERDAMTDVKDRTHNASSRDALHAPESCGDDLYWTYRATRFRKRHSLEELFLLSVTLLAFVPVLLLFDFVVVKCKNSIMKVHTELVGFPSEFADTAAQGRVPGPYQELFINATEEMASKWQIWLLSPPSENLTAIETWDMSTYEKTALQLDLERMVSAIDRASSEDLDSAILGAGKKLTAFADPILECAGSDKAAQMSEVDPGMNLMCSFETFSGWFGIERMMSILDDTEEAIFCSEEALHRISHAQAELKMVSATLKRIRTNLASRVSKVIHASALAHSANHEDVPFVAFFFEHFQPERDEAQMSLLRLRRLQEQYASILWHEHIIAAVDGMLATREDSTRQALDTLRTLELDETFDRIILTPQESGLQTVLHGEVSVVVQRAADLLKAMSEHASAIDAVGCYKGAASWLQEHLPAAAQDQLHAVEMSNWSLGKWADKRRTREEKLLRDAENQFWGEFEGK